MQSKQSTLFSNNKFGVRDFQNQNYRTTLQQAHLGKYEVKRIPMELNFREIPVLNPGFYQSLTCHSEKTFKIKIASCIF